MQAALNELSDDFQVTVDVISVQIGIFEDLKQLLLFLSLYVSISFNG